jgi:hypothetical protein
VRPAETVVVVPGVPAGVAAEVEVVEPGEAALEPHAETANASTSARARSPTAFVALRRMRCLFSVMGSASLSQMIGT